MRVRRPSDDLVRFIYRAHDFFGQEIPYTELANRFFTNPRTVWRIIKRRILRTLCQRKVDLGPPRATTSNEDRLINQDVAQN